MHPNSNIRFPTVAFHLGRIGPSGCCSRQHALDVGAHPAARQRVEQDSCDQGNVRDVVPSPSAARLLPRHHGSWGKCP